MHQWTPEQLILAAEMAAENDRLHDAVTVLAYLVQNHPDSQEAATARLKYWSLTGTICPEAETAAVTAGREEPARSAPAVGEPAPPGLAAVLVAPDENGGDVEAVGIAMQKEDASRVEPATVAAERESPASTAADASSADHLTEIDEEMSLETSERLGHFLAHLLFAFGFLLIPIAGILIVFSLAFEFLLGWGIFSLVASPLMLGFGQALRLLFDLRRDVAHLSQTFDRR